MLDLSIVIVNWNTRSDLRQCLLSIERETTQISFETIVVDNASADGSKEIIRAEFPHVTLIANPDNRGFAAANNQGIRIARGRYVLLLNSDTLVLNAALQKSVAFADANRGIGILGCQVLQSADQVQRTCFRFPSPLNVLLDELGLSRAFPRSTFFGRAWLGDWDRRSQRDVDVVSGMFMLARREAVADVGLMDEDYFVYAEEADWCYRFWRAGWRCVFAPVAQIVHRDGGGKSTGQTNVRMHVQLQKSLLLFQRKHYGRLAWLAVKLIYVCSNAVRALSWCALALARRAETDRRKRRQAVAALKYQLLGIQPN